MEPSKSVVDCPARPSGSEQAFAMPSGGFRAENILAELADFRVVAPRPAEVAAYLTRHPQLAALAPSIVDAMRQTFGADAEFSLEVYRDPEIVDEYLILYIREDKYDEKTFARIEAACSRFDEALRNVSGDFLVTSDFRRPRARHAV
jgi:hypothetical protein